MNEINEKTYPIRKQWFLKQVTLPFIMPLATIGVVYFGDVLASSPFDLSKLSFLWAILTFYMITLEFMSILNIRRGRGLRYSFGETSIKVQTLSKRERVIPYDKIQAVFVHRRAFGVVSLIIQDSSGDTTAMTERGRLFFSWFGSLSEVVGFSGKRMHFPGLSKDDAERLQTFLSQKTKENVVKVTSRAV